MIVPLAFVNVAQECDFSLTMKLQPVSKHLVLTNPATNSIFPSYSWQALVTQSPLSLSSKECNRKHGEASTSLPGIALWTKAPPFSGVLVFMSVPLCLSSPLCLCVPSFAFPMFDVHSPMKALLALLLLTGLNSLPLTTRLTLYSATRLRREISAQHSCTHSQGSVATNGPSAPVTKRGTERWHAIESLLL